MYLIELEDNCKQKWSNGTTAISVKTNQAQKDQVVREETKKIKAALLFYKYRHMSQNEPHGD